MRFHPATMLAGLNFMVRMGRGFFFFIQARNQEVTLVRRKPSQQKEKSRLMCER